MQPLLTLREFGPALDLEFRRDFDMGIRTRSGSLGTIEYGFICYIERQHVAPKSAHYT
jgi:hypothetical protein